MVTVARYERDLVAGAPDGGIKTADARREATQAAAVALDHINIVAVVRARRDPATNECDARAIR